MVVPGYYFGDKAYVSIIGILLALSTTFGALGAVGAGYSYDHLGSYAPAFHAIVSLASIGAVLALFLKPVTAAAMPSVST
jgi:hypothetical protein